MVADKGKKQKIGEKGEDENNNNYNAEHIDVDLVLSIEKLQEIQDELDRINEKASDEVLELEQKYNEKRKPIYDRRTDIVKSIPDFWLTAFMSHPALGELLTEEDQKIFKHLSSVEVEDSKDVKSGYSITFNFDPNPYFEDTELTKTFAFLDEGTKVTATSIKWKEGMGLPNGVAIEKKCNKRSHAEESFFSWFTGSQQKDDELDEIHDEIAELIKDDLWPNPLTYFNTDADEEDFDEEESDDEEKGSDDTEDDDDEPGDDEEDENGDED